MQTDLLTLYKLIILFILDKVNFPLNNAQISNFILEREYTNYFTIQQVITELQDSQLISTETIRNSTYFKIKPAGKETLDFFSNKISDSIKDDIIEYLKNNQYDLRNEASIIADYYEERPNEFLVRCQVREGNSSIIDLTLNVPNEEEALSICNNWSDKSQAIYAFIMKNLISSEND